MSRKRSASSPPDPYASQERSTVAESLIQSFSRPDAILDTLTARRVQEYMRLDTEESDDRKASDVVDALTRGYVGYGSMTNALVACLKESGVVESSLLDIASSCVRGIVQTHFDSLLADRFVDRISSSRRGDRWIRALVHDDVWRSSLLELASKHPDCLFLHYVVQLVFDAGHGKEIIRLPSATMFFRVFHGIVSENARECVVGHSKGQDSRVLVKKASDLQETVRRHEFSFVYASFLLTRLGQFSNCQILSSLARSLQFHHSSSGLQFLIRCLLMSRTAVVDDGVKESVILQPIVPDRLFWEVAHSVADFLASEDTSVAIVVGQLRMLPDELISLYQEPLLTSTIIDKLLDDIFSHLTSVQNTEHVRSVAQVIAKLTAPSKQVKQETLSNSLLYASILCRDRFLDGKIDLIQFGRYMEPLLEHRIVSAGFIRFLRIVFTDEDVRKELFRDSSRQKFFICLIEQIVFLHPFLQPRILSLLELVYHTVAIGFEGSVLDQFRTGLVPVLVLLFFRGIPMSVIDCVRSFATSEQALGSIVSNFFSEIFTLAQPPLSSILVEEIVSALSCPQVQNVIRHRSIHATRFVETFLSDSSDVKISSELREWLFQNDRHR